MSGRDHVGSSLNRHGVLDGAHDRVNRGVDAESLLDDLGVEIQLLQVLPGQRLIAKDTELLLVQFLGDLGAGRKSKDDPGGSRRRRVLSSHQEGNHHVSNLLVGNRGAVLVGAGHQVPNHILRVLLATLFATLADNVNVSLGELALRSVTAAVVRKRGPGKHEVNGGESHIQVVVHFGESGVEAVANLLSLERARRSVDGDFRDNLRDIECALVGLECGRALDEVVDLVGDQGNIGAERLGGETEFHELFETKLISQEVRILLQISSISPSSVPSTSRWDNRRQHRGQKRGW